MASLLNKTTILSNLRSHSQKTDHSLTLRGFHVEPGPREKALLAEDPSLKRFKSHKKSVWRLKRIGDVLTIVVVAVSTSLEPSLVSYKLFNLLSTSVLFEETGCCYEIYVKAVMREDARKQASGSA
ncbi:hypothetical protein RHGRI_034892 [Rhododendron griersonianum]|uniref:Uncharacterized protein n=1 Tax=Rhododendron griersonianum TaxID=479676 RepID=A0AAV6I592_9ERIC|nr:hypothetical protein RHGRI_034892 [Rhododendron griersonianum]